MNMRIDEDDFEEQLELFSDAYDETFQSALPIGPGDNINDVWHATREAVLPDFPLLQYLYGQHGIYRHVPYDDQPLAAKLGRKVAGVMSSTVRRYDTPQHRNGRRETTETEDIPDDALYIKPPSIGDASDIRRKHANPRTGGGRTRPDRSDSLVQALAGMEKGQYARLQYEDEKSLRKDQALLRIAVRRLGWFQGLDSRYLPWESWMETDDEYYYMIVVRLEEPKLKRRTRT